MRGPIVAVLVVCVLAVMGCSEARTAATKTQVTLRIQVQGAALLEKMTHVRVSLLRKDAQWVAAGSATIPIERIRWPLDVPIFPRAEDSISKPFEAIVDALAGDERLAQTRAISSYVPNSLRVLEVWLHACPEHEQGFVCAADDCHGQECEICAVDGSCEAVGVTDPRDLPAFNPKEVPTEALPPDWSAEPVDGGQPFDGDPAMDATSQNASDREAGAADGAGAADDGGGAQPDSSAEQTEAGAEAGPAPEYALGEAGKPCAGALDQSLACEGHASRKALKCQQGIWQVLQTCASTERCESRVGTEQGTCAPIPAACVGKMPGDVCDGTVRLSCGVDLVSVTTKACPSHAQCSSAETVRCACDVGYQDDGQGGCQNPNDCPAQACANGSCVDGLGDYTCNCNSGFAGTGTKVCTAVLYCPKDACTPGGTCVDTASWSCQCASGFSGTGTRACANINDCPQDRCQAPAGTCVDGINTHGCTCNPGFSGMDCVNDICTPNPCRNGGTCSRTGTLCTCPAGFSGANCQIDACSPNPCQHGGVCSRTAQGASCSCGSGSSGYNGPLRARH
jgi:EGF-like domain